MVNGRSRQQTLQAWAQDKRPQQGQKQPSGVALGQALMHWSVTGLHQPDSAGRVSRRVLIGRPVCQQMWQVSLSHT